MKFVKEENGNIRVTDDSGNNLDLIQDIGSRVASTNLGNSISITQNGFEILRFDTADVTATQVLPAAEIAFAGTTSDLIQILTDDFFLISSGGGGGGCTCTCNVNVSEVGFDPRFLDAFARLRFSSPETLFDSKQLSDQLLLFWDDQQTSGSGATSTYNTNQASTTLSVAATTAGKRVRQTYRRFNYQSGKSQLIVRTGVIGEPVSGITKEFGMHDDNNGLFFASGSGSVSVNVRTFTSGSSVDTTINQADWNGDKLDGTGASGLNIDWNNATIFFFDFEWLGVGDIRFGIFYNGMPIVCHTVFNASANTLVYMSTPNLPLRTSIENDGTGASAGITDICSTVISEGGQDNTGLTLGINRGTNSLTTNNNASLYPLIAIRLNSNYLGSTVKPESFSVVCTSTATYAWYLLLDPVLTGTAFSWTALSNSSIDYDIARTNTTTVAGGTILKTGVGRDTNQGGSGSAAVINDFALGSNISGISNILVLAVQRLNGTSETFFGGLNWLDQK